MCYDITDKVRVYKRMCRELRTYSCDTNDRDISVWTREHREPRTRFSFSRLARADTYFARFSNELLARNTRANTLSTHACIYETRHGRGREREEIEPQRATISISNQLPFCARSAGIRAQENAEANSKRTLRDRQRENRLRHCGDCASLPRSFLPRVYTVRFQCDKRTESIKEAEGEEKWRKKGTFLMHGGGGRTTSTLRSKPNGIDENSLAPSDENNKKQLFWNKIRR